MQAIDGRDAVRVLIVDDNRDFAENLAALAQLQGLEPAVAHDRRQALALARDGAFDVAVVDQKLPDGRGTELLAELRRLAPDLVALVVTAFVSLDNSLAALNEGAFAFVGKDADPEELVATLVRAAENARLRRENRGLRGLQESILLAIPDFLVLVDAQGRVQSANQRHPAFCLHEPAQVLGRPLREVVASLVRDQLDLAAWLEDVMAGRAPHERTLELRDVRGRSSIFGLRAVRLDHAPKPQMLLRAVDLTERISLERRLTETEHLATLGRLVSSIAHEIRNPLAGIRALAQLLERRLKAEPRDRENAEEILALTDRMHATLSDLLAFARPAPRRDEPIELGALLEGLVVEARRWPAADGRRVELVREADARLELVAARDRVTGLFANLLENALHAAPAGGCARLTCRRRADRFEVDVEDDGPGIPDEMRASLFQPFFTTKTRGTGLGLSIVKKTVDALAGTIEVDRSAALGGALFRVGVPALAAE